MKERPILFSAPMVRAILAGQKTQTRRVVKPQGAHHLFPFLDLPGNPTGEWAWCSSSHVVSRHIHCPYGQPGDRLWVKETWADLTETHGARWERFNDETRRYERGVDPFVWYRADGDLSDKGDGNIHYAPWRPSIFMPRWASRIQLEVVSVRVERLNDISEDDCWAEGIVEVMHLLDNFSQAEMAKRLGLCLEDAKPLYAQFWESINGTGSWDANPWVWVVEFRRVA